MLSFQCHHFYRIHTWYCDYVQFCGAMLLPSVNIWWTFSTKSSIWSVRNEHQDMLTSTKTEGMKTSLPQAFFKSFFGQSSVFTSCSNVGITAVCTGGHASGRCSSRIYSSPGMIRQRAAKQDGETKTSVTESGCLNHFKSSIQQS